MLPDTYRMLAERESYYWWHKARRHLSKELLRRSGVSSGCSFLDLGSGTGGSWLFQHEMNSSLGVGVDLSPIALEETKKKYRDANLIRADLNKPLPFRGESFDVITIFNVLYHKWVMSEESVVFESYRVLKPGGFLLVTEPAFRILERNMDLISMGKRRYSRLDVEKWCCDAGLEVIYSGYFTSFGFFVVLLEKILRGFVSKFLRMNASPSLDTHRINPIINNFLNKLADLESLLISHGVRFPVGTTVVCLARKSRGL